MAPPAPEGVEQLAARILDASRRNAPALPHVVFSLDYGTSRDGFKARYRELAKALHPDKAKSKAAEEAFKGERGFSNTLRRIDIRRARAGAGGGANEKDFIKHSCLFVFFLHPYLFLFSPPTHRSLSDSARHHTRSLSLSSVLVVVVVVLV